MAAAPTRLARIVFLGAAVALVVAVVLGWFEFEVLAIAGFLLLALCVPFVLGRTTLAVSIDVEPRRVVVGEPVAGRVEITNRGRGRLLPVVLELPMGEAVTRFSLPAIARGGTHSELFIVPTARRGVIDVGPATTVRGDPLGVYRRAHSWTGRIPIYVHPRTVPLDALGSGLLRDLEGTTTDEVSMSDLAFHSLRGYTPGDDRRHIHWRSSAKLPTGLDEETFLVRQFLDTRRSHVTVVLDDDPAGYRAAEDYETAVGVAASVARRAIGDDIATTLASGPLVARGSGLAALDLFATCQLAAPGKLTGREGTSSGQPGSSRLASAVREVSRRSTDTSLAVLVSGTAAPMAVLRAAAAQFSPQVRVVAIRVDRHVAPSRASVETLTLLTVAALDQVGPMLAAGAAR